MVLDLQIRSLLKLNMKLFLDMHLMRSGAFLSISSGQLFYDGSDMSVLLPDTKADDTLFGVADGQVWQLPFRNLVYESGVVIDGRNVSNTSPPIAMSGVYVEGAFRATDDPDFPHVIDYKNARVIFDSPQSSELQVNADFSIKDVRVGFEHDFNQQFNKGYLNSKYTTNPLTSNHLVYPSGFAQPFPAVFIEVDDRSFDAYEIGNRSAIINDEIKLWVWALDDIQRDNIVDILSAQWRKTLPIIDFNVAPLPLSGIYNTLSYEYVPYQEMLRNQNLETTIGNSTPVRYLTYIDEVETQNLGATEEYERSLVTFKVKTYLNAPTTPMGHVFDPISSIGTIEDTGLS